METGIINDLFLNQSLCGASKKRLIFLGLINKKGCRNTTFDNLSLYVQIDIFCQSNCMNRLLSTIRLRYNWAISSALNS